jgi:ribosomal protein S20
MQEGITDNGRPASVTVSCLFDITDPKLFWPQTDQLLQLFNVKENPLADFSFRMKAITDKQVNPLLKYHLADANSTNEKNNQHDPQNRNRNILTFYSTVRTAVTNFYNQIDTSHSMQNSECFRAINDELSFLSGIISDKKILTVFSDLMEKSDLLNSYIEDISDSKRIATKLDSIQPRLKNLTGIKIIFVFNPHNRKEDRAFVSMAEAYKILLQKKGASVSIQANL